MQFLQQSFYENMQKSQADYMEEVKQIKYKQEEIWNNTNRFQSQFRQEQERLAREIQEVRKRQINQTLVNNKRVETEKNLQQAVERKGRDIAEMRNDSPKTFSFLYKRAIPASGPDQVVSLYEWISFPRR
ncbi:hypothetical protein PIB30_102286, partial [Stylosanthes scabra]|nr:hypothetical protein [Stylosanthes scabra]